VEKIRAASATGHQYGGSLLDAWWKRLAAASTPVRSLHRLPESVAHVRKLMEQALEEGRRRALIEQRMTDRALAQDKERLELRSHVLTCAKVKWRLVAKIGANHLGAPIAHPDVDRLLQRNKPAAMRYRGDCRRSKQICQRHTRLFRRLPNGPRTPDSARVR